MWRCGLKILSSMATTNHQCRNIILILLGRPSRFSLRGRRLAANAAMGICKTVSFELTRTRRNFAEEIFQFKKRQKPYSSASINAYLWDSVITGSRVSHQRRALTYGRSTWLFNCDSILLHLCCSWTRVTITLNESFATI